eukprot:5508447-Ditylum_brightwellii.AAC.1
MELLSEVEETVDANGTLINQHPAYDSIINAELQLHHQGNLTIGKVKRRTLGPNVRTATLHHANLILNSTVYEVEYPDREVKEYTANMVAENMLTQVEFE